jgi:hypothetical protein
MAAGGGDDASRGSIRGWLLLGFGFLLALLALAGAIGRRSLVATGDSTRETLALLQAETMLSARLQAGSSLAIASAGQYLRDRDTTARRQFGRSALEAHGALRAMNKAADQDSRETVLLSTIDARLSEMEVRYARAHVLADLGRVAEANAQADTARGTASRLGEDVQRLAELRAGKIGEQAERLEEQAHERSAWLLGVIAASVLLAAVVVAFTLSRIGRPLAALVAHARELSRRAGCRASSTSWRGRWTGRASRCSGSSPAWRARPTTSPARRASSPPSPSRSPSPPTTSPAR